MLDEFFAAHRYSQATIASYSRLLTLFLAEVEVGPSTPSAQALAQWLDKPSWGPQQRWVAFNAVRAYLKWRFGSYHPALRLRLKRPTSPMQRVLRLDEARRILEHFPTTPKGIRDKAIFSLFLDTGLRVSEMCRVDLDHLDMRARALWVVVKGGKWGKAVFSHTTAERLSKWLEIRPRFAVPSVRTVFVSLNGKTKGRPLTRHGLQLIVRRWGEAVGIRLSPHDLRRTFATLATRAGAPERILMEAGRWQSTEMIALYTRSISAEDFEPYFPTRMLED